MTKKKEGIIADPPDFQCYTCGHEIQKVALGKPTIKECPECKSPHVLDLHVHKFEENIPGDSDLGTSEEVKLKKTQLKRE